MNCQHCETEMVGGVVGKQQPFQLRFVPNDHKVFVWDYAQVIACACPACGAIQLAVDPAKLLETVSKT